MSLDEDLLKFIVLHPETVPALMNANLLDGLPLSFGVGFAMFMLKEQGIEPTLNNVLNAFAFGSEDVQRLGRRIQNILYAEQQRVYTQL